MFRSRKKQTAPPNRTPEEEGGKRFPTWVARHWLKFLFKHHGTKRIIIMTHADCGWYKFVNFAQVFSEKIRNLQRQDGAAAQAAIEGIAGSAVAVECYFIDRNGARFEVYAI